MMSSVFAIHLNQSIAQSLKDLQSIAKLLQSWQKPAQISLFLRGAAIKSLDRETWNSITLVFAPWAVDLYVCSAHIEFKNQWLPFTANICGLGTWVHLAASLPHIDLAVTNSLPDFILLDADPSDPLFDEQLDLALAAASFDMSIDILISGAAKIALQPQFSELPAVKKMNSALLYGVKDIYSRQYSTPLPTKRKSQLIVPSIAVRSIELISADYCTTIIRLDDPDLSLNSDPLIVVR